jgi:hypothetical protein
MSRLRVILLGFLYLAAMLICGTLLAALIAQVRSVPRQATVPTSTPSPALAAPTLAASATLPSTAVRPTVTLRATATLYPTSTPDDASAVCGPSQGGYQWHYVQWGETLSGLALQYGVSEREIRRANGLRWWSDRIIAGWCLLIPRRG